MYKKTLKFSTAWNANTRHITKLVSKHTASLYHKEVSVYFMQHASNSQNYRTVASIKVHFHVTLQYSNYLYLK